MKGETVCSKAPLNTPGHAPLTLQMDFKGITGGGGTLGPLS